MNRRSKSGDNCSSAKQQQQQTPLSNLLPIDTSDLDELFSPKTTTKPSRGRGLTREIKNLLITMKPQEFVDYNKRDATRGISHGLTNPSKSRKAFSYNLRSSQQSSSNDEKHDHEGENSTEEDASQEEETHSENIVCEVDVNTRYNVRYEQSTEDEGNDDEHDDEDDDNNQSIDLSASNILPNDTVCVDGLLPQSTKQKKKIAQNSSQRLQTREIRNLKIMMKSQPVIEKRQSRSPTRFEARCSEEASKLTKSSNLLHSSQSQSAAELLGTNLKQPTLQSETIDSSTTVDGGYDEDDEDDDDDDDDEELYEIEEIRRVFHKSGVKFYEIKWFDDEITTVEPAEDIDAQCPDIESLIRRSKNVKFLGAAAVSSLTNKKVDVNVSVEEPFIKSSGAFGSVIETQINVFSERGLYSDTRGLGWFKEPYDNNKNVTIQNEFLNSVFEEWALCFGVKGAHLAKVVGTNMIDQRSKNMFKYKSDSPVPFLEPETARKELSRLLKDHNLVCFLVVNGFAKNDKSDQHCGVGIIENYVDEPRKFYYFDTRVKQEVEQQIPSYFLLSTKRLAKDGIIYRGYGQQNEKSDCVERSLHFIAALRDGIEWKNFAPKGWVIYDKNFKK